MQTGFDYESPEAHTITRLTVAADEPSARPNETRVHAVASLVLGLVEPRRSRAPGPVEKLTRTWRGEGLVIRLEVFVNDAVLPENQRVEGRRRPLALRGRLRTQIIAATTCPLVPRGYWVLGRRGWFCWVSVLRCAATGDSLTYATTYQCGALERVTPRRWDHRKHHGQHERIVTESNGEHPHHRESRGDNRTPGGGGGSGGDIVPEPLHGL